MASVRSYQISLVQTSSGAGTVTSDRPLTGEIVEVRMPNSGTAIADSGGTADFTFTRIGDGGTVLKLTNVAAPWQYHPRRVVHSDTGGTTAYNTGVGPVYDAGGGIPINDHLQVVWTQGSAAAGTATVWVHIREP